MPKGHRPKAKARSRSQLISKQNTHGPASQVTEPWRFLRAVVGLLLLLAIAAVIYSTSPYFQAEDRDEQADTSMEQTQGNSNAKSLENRTAEELEAHLKLPKASSQPASALFDEEAWTAKLDEALRSLDSELPGDAQAAHLQGLIHLRLKRTKLAEPLLRRAVTLAPGDQEMKLDLSELLSQLGRDDEALEALTVPLSAPPTAAFLTQLGDCQSRLGKIEDAVASFAAALQLEPGSAPLWLKLGNAQLQLQKYAECEASARRVIELDSENANAWSMLGRALSILKRGDDAKMAMARARELSTPSPNAQPQPFEVARAQSTAKVVGGGFRSLALLYQAKGQANKADAMFRQAMQVDPQDWVALGKWAALLRRLGEFDQAAALHRRLVAEQPDEWAHYQNLANISMELNRPGDAEAALRLACWRLPNDGQRYLLLAKFLLLLNKAHEAVKPARTACELLKNAEATELLKQVEQVAR